MSPPYRSVWCSRAAGFWQPRVSKLGNSGYPNKQLRVSKLGNSGIQIRQLRVLKLGRSGYQNLAIPGIQIGQLWVPKLGVSGYPNWAAAGIQIWQLQISKFGELRETCSSIIMFIMLNVQIFSRNIGFNLSMHFARAAMTSGNSVGTGNHRIIDDRMEK